MSFAVLIAVLLLLGVGPWTLFTFNVRLIEKRLDQQHDYFRYFDRDTAPSLGSHPTVVWLKDFMAKYSESEFSDPVLDRLVDRQRAIRSIQIACGIAWAVFACLWMTFTA